MERDIYAIVAEQLESAQDEHAQELRIVERVQRTLNKRTAILARAGERLINIEEIHNKLYE